MRVVVVAVTACVAAVMQVGCASVVDVSGYRSATAELRVSAGEAGDVVSRAIERVEVGGAREGGGSGGGGLMLSERFHAAWSERLRAIDAMGDYATRMEIAAGAGDAARGGVMEFVDAAARLASAAGVGAGVGGGGGGAVGGVVVELGASVAEVIASMRASASVAAAVRAADPLVFASAELLAADVESMRVIVRVSHEEARARVMTGEAGIDNADERRRAVAAIAASEAGAVDVLDAMASALRAWAVSHAVVVVAIEQGGEVDLESLIRAVESVRVLVERVRGVETDE